MVTENFESDGAGGGAVVGIGMICSKFVAAGAVSLREFPGIM